MLQRLACNQYQVIIVSPEIFNNNSWFEDWWGTKKFTDNLVNIVLDKAHVVKEWGGTFHLDYLWIGPVHYLLTPSSSTCAFLSFGAAQWQVGSASNKTPNNSQRLGAPSFIFLLMSTIEKLLSCSRPTHVLQKWKPACGWIILTISPQYVSLPAWRAHCCDSKGNCLDHRSSISLELHWSNVQWEECATGTWAQSVNIKRS